MNQVNSNTNKRTVNPSPLFGSIWVALYCVLRDGHGTVVPANEPAVDVHDKNVSEAKPH